MWRGFPSRRAVLRGSDKYPAGPTQEIYLVPGKQATAAEALPGVNAQEEQEFHLATGRIADAAQDVPGELPAVCLHDTLAADVGEGIGGHTLGAAEHAEDESEQTHVLVDRAWRQPSLPQVQYILAGQGGCNLAESGCVGVLDGHPPRECCPLEVVLLQG